MRGSLLFSSVELVRSLKLKSCPVPVPVSQAELRVQGTVFKRLGRPLGRKEARGSTTLRCGFLFIHSSPHCFFWCFSSFLDISPLLTHTPTCLFPAGNATPTPPIQPHRHPQVGPSHLPAGVKELLAGLAWITEPRYGTSDSGCKFPGSSCSEGPFTIHCVPGPAAFGAPRTGGEQILADNQGEATRGV